MKVLITGGTGFIGTEISKELIKRNFKIIILTRKNIKDKKDNIKFIRWNGKNIKYERELEGVKVFINLAGENIFSIRWTERKKKKILESRVNSGKALLELIKKLKRKPLLFIQGSAIGFYRESKKPINEEGEIGDNFLSKTVELWENSTKELENMGIRRITTRIGIVLGKGGMFKKILPAFKFFLGGILGDKKRFISWIHIKDVVNSILFFIDKKELKGVFNLTSPQAVTAEEFYRTIGEILKRPCLLNIPDPVLRIIMGEMAENTLFVDQKVIPEKLIKAGYKFKYPTLREALKQIIEN